MKLFYIDTDTIDTPAIYSLRNGSKMTRYGIQIFFFFIPKFLSALLFSYQGAQSWCRKVNP
jgi:hypothetical protein